MNAAILTHQSLINLLDYSPISGVFTWRVRPRNHFKNVQAYGAWNTKFAGKEAGGIDGKRYIRINIDKCKYYTHRLAWLYIHGEWPKNQIDHINRDKTDNRIQNLRDVTNQVNCQNMPMRNSNTSGITGVSWYKNINRWAACIKVDGKTKHGGTFKNKDDAISRREEMGIEHGFHKNHGNSIA